VLKLSSTVERIFLSKNRIEKIRHQFILAGIKTGIDTVIKRLFFFSLGLGVVVFAALLLIFEVLKGSTSPVLDLIIYFLTSIFGVFAFLLILIYMYVVVKKNSRKKQIEELLSDYLLLVSANVSAGMTIDQALWYAVRKRFGVLAEEMEIVVKKTMSGERLNDALIEFTEKYDSDVLKKTFVLLLEGMDSGGEVSELINKISWSVKENQIIKKEVASSVASYSIFILFAALVAAPLLFALSQKIIVIMSELTKNLDLSSIASVKTQIPINSMGGGINVTDFKRFAASSLVITATFAAMIVSSVKTGTIKEGFKNIPIYIAISMILYLLISVAMAGLFADIGA